MKMLSGLDYIEIQSVQDRPLQAGLIHFTVRCVSCSAGPIYVLDHLFFERDALSLTKSKIMK